MSSIDSISGAGSELSLLQQLIANRRGTADGASFAPPPPSGQAGNSRQADFEAQFTQAALAAGLNTEDAEGLQEEIKTAVAAATQGAAGSTDKQEAVRGAIDGVLQKHGVNLDKFRGELQKTMGNVGGPPPGGPPPGGAHGADFESKFNDAAIAAGLDADTKDELQTKIKSAIQEILGSSDSSSDPRQPIQSTIDNLLTTYGVDLTEFKSLMQSNANGGAIPLVDEQA